MGSNQTQRILQYIYTMSFSIVDLRWIANVLVSLRINLDIVTLVNIWSTAECQAQGKHLSSYHLSQNFSEMCPVYQPSAI